MPESLFLKPASFLDADHPRVVAFAGEATAGAEGDLARALALYAAVRDGVAYEAYLDFTDPETFRASSVLAAGKGFCVGKAAVLAACARASGIPARVGYADVKNHMTSRRLYEHLQTDVFIWHSYADLCIEGRWVKATPAFDRRVCEKAGVAPLAFDGRQDSLFQPYSADGRRHMQYLRDRGTFADVPFATIRADFESFYPGMRKTPIAGAFADEVERGT
ncbi:MAG: transglutaminase domain-containing protein [Hyphomicrobiaceae bacterium]|nr:transglutaminase domain-containing protein [Hyphomicrobiaceae bacterium]